MRSTVQVGPPVRTLAHLREAVVVDAEARRPRFRRLPVEAPLARLRQPLPAQVVEVAAPVAELLPPPVLRVPPVLRAVAVHLRQAHPLLLAVVAAVEADAARPTHSNSSARFWIPARR